MAAQAMTQQWTVQMGSEDQLYIFYAAKYESFATRVKKYHEEQLEKVERKVGPCIPCTPSRAACLMSMPFFAVSLVSSCILLPFAVSLVSSGTLLRAASPRASASLPG